LCVGNKYLHLLTKQRQRLRLDLLNWDGQSKYVEFDDFAVGDEESKFELISLGVRLGNAG